MIVEIRKPEITKKISTPINPLFIQAGKAWKATTNSTAIALNPSMSGRYCRCDKWEVGVVISARHTVAGAPQALATSWNSKDFVFR
jgi:hypothetical protein